MHKNQQQIFSPSSNFMPVHSHMLEQHCIKKIMDCSQDKRKSSQQKHLRHNKILK